MPEQKTESEELHSWLHERMKEADLTPTEVSEFTRWLMSRSCDHLETGHKNGSVSFTEVLELVCWVRGRMSDLLVQDDERREFSNWLADRLSAHSCLTDDELRRVHEEIAEKF